MLYFVYDITPGVCGRCEIGTVIQRCVNGQC